MASTGDAATGRRFAELDALRGLAALSVVFSHLACAIPGVDLVDGRRRWDAAAWILNTPVHMAWAGAQAVFLFFVLSGFVLALPYFGRGPIGYRSFLVRRWWRIYPPFLAAVTLTLTVRALVAARPAGASWWVHGIWSSPITAGQVLRHVTLVGWFDTGMTNPVLWSLVHEMRLSLAFPLLVWCVRRWPAPRVLAGSVLVGLGGFLAGVVCPDPEHLFETVMYSMLFLVGAVLAKHHRRLAAVVAGMPGVGQLLLVVAAAWGYTSAFWLPGPEAGLSRFLVLVVTTAACGVFVVAAIGCHPLGRVLRTGPGVFLGRVSYSLYLVHAVVIAGLVDVFAGLVSLPVILVLALVGSLGLAAVMYQLIEAPGIAAGRRYGRRLGEREPLELPQPAEHPVAPHIDRVVEVPARR